MDRSWAKDYPPIEEIREETIDENNSLKKMLYLVGENKRVIDFGCATGYFAQLLSQKGCTVTGVELNPDAAKVAQQHCEEVIVADLDFTSVTQILPKHEFDVVVFGDVLEHLRNPWALLQETKYLLRPEGYVVASIPNIAHGAIRLALLQGKFEYTELGILDNTHLRFFTRRTVEELFEKSGYFLDTIERTKLPVFSDNALIPHINKNDFNTEIIRRIEQEEEVETLQFVIRALPGNKEGKYAALNERYLKLIVQWEQSQAQLQQSHTEKEQLHSQLQQSQAELEQSQAQLQQSHTEKEQLHSQLQQSQTELEQSQAQLQQSHTEKEQLHSQLQQSQTELEQSQTQLQQSHAEKEQLHSQLQQSQTELEQSQTQLQQSHAEKEQLHSQLQQSQTELEQSQTQLQQSHAEKEQLHPQLQQSQTELEQSQTQLQQSQTELEQSQAQLYLTQAESGQLQIQWQQSQTDLEYSRTIISAMESSKFWKLRTAWFRLKNLTK